MASTLLNSSIRRLCSLQGRLLVGLVTTWLAIVGLLLMLAWLFGKELVEDASVAHLRYDAQLIADGLTDNVNRRLSSLERLASLLEGREPEELKSLLEDNQALLEWFEGIMVTGPDGRVLADWPMVEGRVGLETAGTEYFRMVRHSPWPYVSRPFVGRASGEPLVLMLVPRIGERGEFRGVVGGMVNLVQGGLFRRLEAVRLGDVGYVSVFAASGELLFHPRRDRELVEAVNQQDLVTLDLALSGWQGEAVARGVYGEPALVAYRQVWPADWVVGAVLPKSQVYEPLGSFLARLWWAWLGVAVLLLASMYWLVKKLLAPLQRLERQIGEVVAGERRYLALSTHMDELQQVANTFNRLEHERHAALEHLKDRQAFLDAVLGSTPLGMFVADLQGRLTYMNPALLELLGLGRVSGARDWWGRIHSADRQGAEDMWRHTLSTGSEFVRQLRFVNGRDETLWLEVHASQVRGSEQPLGFVGMVKDITESRQQEALQRWEAEHDPLTGLLNRRGFERRLEEALAEYAKTGTPSVLILFDLDHFKPINDEGGHALGDEMLRRIAQVVAWEVRRSDHVARQGGDEFAILLPSCTLRQATKIAEALRQAVSEIGVTHGGREYRVTLSIGVASLQEGDLSIETVLARADAACYRAKSAGRDEVVVSEGGEVDHSLDEFL
ncbi:diguanylate cyclase [Halomonas campisalis]|uniref:Diguanylate cyclase n=1 Tax=Billgrantia campisalis TaxID=74661 RepID=A0ABS9P3B7_9GAMM|nr:diguanylate cyclase [Halomonas campisalis]MCG6656271.1 diguanylate cyclase [Halomonas campisalis]MDR5861458.1 diguanylate cyclase [Halomonas campisalis]